MPDTPRNEDDDEPRKRFPIQRKRLGTIKFVHEKGEYGFIEAEDFRDDVFFHHTVWESAESGDSDGARRSENPLSGSLVDKWVEFEIDDEIFSTEKKLRAKVVRLTDRPQGRKLKASDATFKMPRHHPKARRKKPNWRK